MSEYFKEVFKDRLNGVVVVVVKTWWEDWKFLICFRWNYISFVNKYQFMSVSCQFLSCPSPWSLCAVARNCWLDWENEFSDHKEVVVIFLFLFLRYPKGIFCVNACMHVSNWHLFLHFVLVLTPKKMIFFSFLAQPSKQNVF